MMSLSKTPTAKLQVMMKTRSQSSGRPASGIIVVQKKPACGTRYWQVAGIHGSKSHTLHRRHGHAPDSYHQGGIWFCDSTTMIVCPLAPSLAVSLNDHRTATIQSCLTTTLPISESGSKTPFLPVLLIVLFLLDFTLLTSFAISTSTWSHLPQVSQAFTDPPFGLTTMILSPGCMLAVFFAPRLTCISFQSS